MTGRNKIVAMLMERTPRRYHASYVPKPITGQFAVILFDDVYEDARVFVEQHQIFSDLHQAHRAELQKAVIGNAYQVRLPAWYGWAIRIQLMVRPGNNAGYHSPLGRLAARGDEYVIFDNGRLRPDFGGLSGRRMSLEDIETVVSEIPMIGSTMNIDAGAAGYDHERDKIKLVE